MPTWLKVIGAIFAIGLCVVAAASFMAYRWFRENRAQLMDVGKQALAEGAAYGAGKEADACIAETLRRIPATRAMTSEVKGRLFLRGCLSKASDAKVFCESVPRNSEIIAAAEWSVNECRRHDAADNPRCAPLLYEAVTYCEWSIPK